MSQITEDRFAQAGVAHSTSVIRAQAVLGEQQNVNEGFTWAFILFGITFSITSVLGVWTYAEWGWGWDGLIQRIVGTGGIIISDYTLYKINEAFKRHELTGDEKRFAIVLAYVAMADILGGTLAKTSPDTFAPMYFQYGMWIMLTAVMAGWQYLKVVIGRAQELVDEWTEAELQVAMSEVAAERATKHARASEKREKAVAAIGQSQSRMATIMDLYRQLRDMPNRMWARRKLKQLANAHYDKFLFELAPPAGRSIRGPWYNPWQKLPAGQALLMGGEGIKALGEALPALSVTPAGGDSAGGASPSFR